MRERGWGSDYARLEEYFVEQVGGVVGGEWGGWVNWGGGAG